MFYDELTMKNQMRILFFTLMAFLFFSRSEAGLLMTYHQLALKDLDEMNELVNGKIKESKKTRSGKVVPLKEGLQAVFSRPNEDGMVAKVYFPLRSELERLDSLEKIYRDLTDEAMNALQNTKNFKADVQVTYAIFLENLIAEFKPLIKDDGFEKKTIEKIAKASIELTKEALKERKRRLMKEGESPSVLAELVLKQAEEKKAEAPPAAESKPSTAAPVAKPAEQKVDPSVVPDQEFEADEKSK